MGAFSTLMGNVRLVVTARPVGLLKTIENCVTRMYTTKSILSKTIAPPAIQTDQDLGVDRTKVKCVQLMI